MEWNHRPPENPPLVNALTAAASPAEAKPEALVKATDPAKQVIAWMVSGHREDDIASSLAEHFPGSEPAKLLDAAVEHFANASRCPSDVLLGWALEAYRDLYRRTLEIGDFQGAAKMVKEIVRLAQTQG